MKALRGYLIGFLVGALGLTALAQTGTWTVIGGGQSLATATTGTRGAVTIKQTSTGPILRLLGSDGISVFEIAEDGTCTGAGCTTIPVAADPTTDAAGEIAFDTDAWAASRGALEVFDGTASTFVVATLASDAPSNGQVPKWNTGGTITWETDNSAGSPTFDTIGDPAGAGTIAFGTTQQDITSTLDSAAGIVFQLTNTDADRANSTTLFQLADNDAAGDAQAIYFNVVADADGTPSNLFQLRSDGISSLLDIGFGANPADAGPLRLSNNTVIGWEAATPGTDLTLGVNGSDVLVASGAMTVTGAFITSSTANLSAGTATFGTIAGTIDGGSATSFEVPNGANPTTDAFGEVAADNDAWAASRGALEFFDGTASVFVVAALASDTPSNGQVPKWNTGGTITWENDADSGGTTEFDDFGDPSGNGAVALANTTHAWTSTLDSAAAVVLSLANTDADRANATTLFRLADNDAAGDADAVMFTVVADLDGTPSTVFSITLAAITSTLDITVPTEVYDATGWNGDLTVPTKDAIRDYIEANFVIADAEVATWLVTPSSANLLAAIDDETGTGLAVFATSPTFTTSILLGSAGVSFADDGDGALTILGRGNGSDEDLTLNLDDTSNTAVWSSSTGLATWNMGGMAMTNMTFVLPYSVIFNAGVIQNATCSIGANLPTTLGAGSTACEGTAAASGYPAYGTALFPTGGANTEWHNHFPLPTGWTGVLSAKIKWRAADTTANDVVWQVAFGCTAAGEASTAISFNTTSFTADTNNGTTLQHNDTADTTLTTTGCSAGETAFFKVMRDTDTAGDTLDADVQMISIEFTVRRTVTIA